MPKPFEGNYPASLVTAITALIPFIIISTAYTFYRNDVAMQFHQTRTALEIIAALAISGFAIFTLALFTLPGADPFNPGMPLDLTGVLLALAATMLPFWAVGELSGPGFRSPLFIAPLVIGLIAFVALIVVEYNKEEPLAPVKLMWHTFPLIGTLAAMAGGAAFVTVLALTEQLLQSVLQRSVLAPGLMFWPMVPGVVISAVALGLLLRTRTLPLLIVIGMLVLIGAGLLIMPSAGAPNLSVIMMAAGMLGVGAGATVAPGLNLAAFSLPSKIVGRVFALVELVRSVADYLLAPIMLAVARTVSGGSTPDARGIAEALASR